MQWRLLDCFRQQRMPELEFLSQASIDLITYMGVKAKDGTMDAPRSSANPDPKETS